MQTVVLAGGKGTRMGPLTDRRPKPTLPVGDRPLVGHVLATAAEAGADRFVVVVGYRRAAITERIGDSYAGVPVEYAVQEDQAGTAHALEQAADALEPGPFAVLNADSLYDPGSLATLYDGGPALGTARVEDPGQYGVVSVADDRVTGVVEKPAEPVSNLVNAGAYVFPDAAREMLSVPESERGERELTDVVERVIDGYEVRPVTFDRWLDVGRPWELLAATEWVLEDAASRVEGEVSADAELRGTVVVESGATVEPGVVIEGPAMVRSGASVGPNAYLRGATVVGPDAHVGHAVEVKNSVLMRGATVGHLAYVGDSVLGREVNFGAGTTVANLRHDDEAVRLTVKGNRVSTGRRKFGVVVGDGAKTGIDTNLDPGVTLSTEATTTPGETVTRDR